MNQIQHAVKRLTIMQQVVYKIICEYKSLKATGRQITSCRSLERIGLIKRNADSGHRSEYVLNGDPVVFPETCNQPADLVGLVKPARVKVTKKVVAPEPEPKVEPIAEPEPMIISTYKPLIRAKAKYDNPSREDHVSKWIQRAVTPDKKAMVKVKCLKDYQMGYVMFHHEQHTAKEMAEKLKVDVLSVKIFCQANAIVPMPEPTKRKSDSFHVIPESKRLRMKRVGYNPQNKTA